MGKSRLVSVKPGGEQVIRFTSRRVILGVCVSLYFAIYGLYLAQYSTLPGLLWEAYFLANFLK
jgi:hypothetical protein